MEFSHADMKLCLMNYSRGSFFLLILHYSKKKFKEYVQVLNWSSSLVNQKNSVVLLKLCMFFILVTELNAYELLVLNAIIIKIFNRYVH